jgi:hypothetical protein
MSKGTVAETLRQQLAELATLKAELDSLTQQLNSGPPPELVALREEIAKLREEEEWIAAEQAKLPANYRVPLPYEPAAGQRHLIEQQPLFPPPTEHEKLTGRVRYLPPEEFICHPLPFERPQGCAGLPPVLARVTCRWGKKKTTD